MKYKIHAVIDFEVEADSRAAAHVAAVDALTAAELPGFDLGKLDVTGSISTDGRVGLASDMYTRGAAMASHLREMVPDFSGTLGEQAAALVEAYEKPLPPA